MVPFVHRETSQQSHTFEDGPAEQDGIYEAGSQSEWGWRTPIPMKQDAPGLIVDDTLVLRTRVRISKVQESFPMPSECRAAFSCVA